MTQTGEHTDVPLLTPQDVSARVGEILGTAEREAREIIAAARGDDDGGRAPDTLDATLDDLARALERLSLRFDAFELATAAQMEGLEKAVLSIGEVVKLINDIASQTNLLALNATIEAARAGEAGKGFAVVAGEVKNLANQTARATGEITEQVSAIQNSTRSMAQAIDNVEATIRSLEEVATTIAGAVQQQEASTREISSTINEVAVEADGVSRTVVDLSKSTSQSCAGTIRVIWSARALANVVNDLNGEVNQFLMRVRG